MNFIQNLLNFLSWVCFPLCWVKHAEGFVLFLFKLSPSCEKCLVIRIFLVLSFGQEKLFWGGSRVGQEKMELFILVEILLISGAFCVRESIVENTHLINMNQMMRTHQWTKPNHFLTEVRLFMWTLPCEGIMATLAVHTCQVLQLAVTRRRKDCGFPPQGYYHQW